MSKQAQILRDLILEHVPADGTPISNANLFERIAAAADFTVSEAAFQAERDALLRDGVLVPGRGRGGSVMRIQPVASGNNEDEAV